MNKRNTAIDIAKAIGIVLMILGHCWEIPYMPIRHLIFTFHMPLFFIISGYFYHNKGIKQSLVQDAKHLMIPYFATCGAIIILASIRALLNGNVKAILYFIAATFIGSGSDRSCMLFSHVPNIGAIWFFPALYVCKNIYNIISQHNNNHTKRLLYSSIIFLCATLIGRYLIFLPFSILSGLSAIIFYSIGDYFKNQSFHIKPIHYIIGIICWFISFKYSHLYLVQPKIDLYFIDVIGATTATIFVYFLSKKLNQMHHISKYISWIGKNSMYILCFHLIDLTFGISSLATYADNKIITILLRILIPLFATVCYIKIKQKHIKVIHP